MISPYQVLTQKIPSRFISNLQQNLIYGSIHMHCTCIYAMRRHTAICFVGPQNAPLHNMLLLVAYCVPCIHNMLRWSILCTLHTQYATRGAYCVGSVHMLFQWSSEGTQYALLEKMSRGICLSFQLSSRHPSVYLTNLMSKAMPAS